MNDIEYEKLLAQISALDTPTLIRLENDLFRLRIKAHQAENAEKRYSITDIRGIFKGVWDGQDAQDYVNQERDSWDE